MYEYQAKVVRVIDGDTVTLDIDLGFGIVMTNTTVRLYGVDTPELHSSNPEERATARRAKEILEHLLSSKTVVVQTLKDKDDKYGRLLAVIKSAEDKVPVNQVLIELGLAKPYFGDKKQSFQGAP